MSRKRRSRSQKEKFDCHDLRFTFENCKMNVFFSDELTDLNVQHKIAEIVEQCSKEIVIDKTYVKCEGNNHEKVFIQECGWNELCDLSIRSQVSKLTVTERAMALEAYKLLIVGYMYQVIDDCGFDSGEVLIEMKERSRFYVQIEQNTSTEWKSYCGKWQTWLENCAT